MDRKKYVDLIEQNSNTNTCHQVLAKNSPDFVKDSVDTAYNLLVQIAGNYNQCQSAEWLLGLDMYTEELRSNFVGTHKNTYIQRGRIIEYDAFGDLGTEQKKRRPAIVLLVNGNDGAIIAPIGKAAYKSGKAYHVTLSSKKVDEGNLKKNCGIKLDQIRYIDKHRITDTFGRVTNTDKLNELDEKLVRNMSRNYYQKHTVIEQENEANKIELVRMAKEISDREDEILKLKRRIHLLEQERISNQNSDGKIS